MNFRNGNIAIMVKQSDENNSLLRKWRSKIDTREADKTLLT